LKRWRRDPGAQGTIYEALEAWDCYVMNRSARQTTLTEKGSGGVVEFASCHSTQIFVSME